MSWFEWVAYEILAQYTMVNFHEKEELLVNALQLYTYVVGITNNIT